MDQVLKASRKVAEFDWYLYLQKLLITLGNLCHASYLYLNLHIQPTPCFIQFGSIGVH